MSPERYPYTIEGKRTGAPDYDPPEIAGQKEKYAEFYERRLEEAQELAATLAENDLANWVADQIDAAWERRRIRS